MTDEQWRIATDKRLKALEDGLRTMETNEAVNKIILQNIELRMGKMERNFDEKLDKFDSTQTWLGRLIIGALILAIVGQLIGGTML